MFCSLNDFHARFSWKDSYIMLYFVTVYFELKLYLFVKFVLCQRPVLPRSAESLREDEFEGRPSVQPSVKPNPSSINQSQEKKTHNPGANLGLIVLYFWLLVEVYLFSVSIWLFWIAQFRHDTWNPSDRPGERLHPHWSLSTSLHCDLVTDAALVGPSPYWDILGWLGSSHETQPMFYVVMEIDMELTWNAV